MKPNRALLILDHGSRQESANEEFRQLAERLRTLRPDLIVEYAHMEVADPDLVPEMYFCGEASTEASRVGCGWGQWIYPSVFFRTLS